MPFNSLPFIVFLFCFTLAYHTFGKKSKTTLLLLGSALFYAYAGLIHLLCLVTAIMLTFKFAQHIKTTRYPKFMLWSGIGLLLFQLICSKYASSLFGAGDGARDSFFKLYVMPIGISFYTLQAISLLVDIYRRQYLGDTSLLRIGQFLSFFPQSIAGPVHRAKELMSQFQLEDIAFKADQIIIGLKYMIWGYVCKLLVADKLAVMISPIFYSIEKQEGAAIFFAAALYMLQLYFDFWGYSLIAIGVGRLLGFEISVNFNQPYAATSFREFWHRWHMTVSRWMRDYIYLPLGGSRCGGKLGFIFAISLTFLVSGFWHGVTINFMLWGALHAFLYLSEWSLSKIGIVAWIGRLNLSKSIMAFLQRCFFLLLLCLTWLVFRTTSLIELMLLFSRMFDFQNWNMAKLIVYYGSFSHLCYLAILLTVGTMAFGPWMSTFIDRVPRTRRERFIDMVFFCSGVGGVVLLGDIGGQEFLYFRF